MTWVGAGSVLVLVVLAGPLGARAAEPAMPDTAVTTRAGAVYQGVLVEQVPGDHISIQTADGKIHRFPAADIASVRSLGPGSATPPAAPQPVSPLPPRRVASGGDDVLVDLSSADPRARLVQMSVVGGGVPAPNPEVCGPPCGVRVAPGTYVVAGTAIIPSPAFNLEPTASRVRISADAVTHDQRTTGLVLSIGGGITAASVGLPLWLFGAAVENLNENSAFPQSDSPGSSFKWTGIVVTAACAVAAVIGLVIYHGPTTVKVEKGGR